MSGTPARIGGEHGQVELAPEQRAAIDAKAIELVRLALEMTSAAGSGHPTSAASLAQLVTVLMYGHMRWDPARPDDPAADRLVLSEGHACPIVYAACADLGVHIDGAGGRRPMTREDAYTLRAIDSPIDGHPNPVEGFPFFPAATGSLGQGLSIAAGLAIAARLDGSDARSFCLIGDGESREGQVWEALDLLSDEQLHAVCPIFNANGQAQTGPVSCQQSPEVLASKLAAFGFEPLSVDGHDAGEVLAALERHAERARQGRGRPIAIVARTVKGWGSPSLADSTAGHHGKPAKAGDELERALEELDREAERLDTRAVGARLGPAPIEARKPRARAGPRSQLPRTLRAALAAQGEEELLSKGTLATRKAYGIALRALGPAYPDLVVLDGDVSNSTHAEDFLDAGPEAGVAGRFIECRIAEQNMVSCAVGLAAAGKRPFASSFGKFLTRAYDQIEMGLYSGAALRLVGSHVGVSLAADGPSQMALPDVAWFASLARVRRAGRPLVHVLTPSDAVSAYALTLRMAEHEGAVYLRTMRPATALLHDEGASFELGGHALLRGGEDVLIVACGYLVHEALRACDQLRERGVGAGLVDAYCLPFDERALVELARGARGRVLTVEDNYGGALGAAVADALAGGGGPFQLEQMFVRRVPKSGREPEDVLELLELSHAHIAASALRLAAR